MDGWINGRMDGMPDLHHDVHYVCVCVPPLMDPLDNV